MKTLKRVALCLFAGALIVTGFAININVYQKNKIASELLENHLMEHTATVSKFDTYYKINSDYDFDSPGYKTLWCKRYVDYTVNGVEYKQILLPDDIEYRVILDAHDTVQYSSCYIGQEITIFYDPNFPEQIFSGHPLLPQFIMLTVIGNILIVFGFCALPFFAIFSAIKKNAKLKNVSYREKSLHKMKKLTEHGELVNAQFEGIVSLDNPKGGANLYMIICKWTDTYSKTDLVFKSEYVTYNPEPIIKAKGITSFPVYIDRDNPKKYYVSLENLL